MVSAAFSTQPARAAESRIALTFSVILGKCVWPRHPERKRESETIFEKYLSALSFVNYSELRDQNNLEMSTYLG